jgi:hypothetical protein
MKRTLLGTLLLLLLATLPAQPGTIPAIWDPSFGSVIVSGDDNVSGFVGLGPGISFPFLGPTYVTAEASTNGFISLGGTNGAGCCSGYVTGSGGLLAGYPRIAPAWMDWVGPVHLNSFADHATFTWDVFEYAVNTHVALFQEQLYNSGVIVFGFDTLNSTSNQGHTMLMGLSPGGGAGDPGPSDFVGGLPFNPLGIGTVYQMFQGGGNMANFDGGNIVFTPNGQGGWDVTGSFVNVVPEPATLGLMASGILALIWVRRRRS